jgi:hypothetical protein
MNRNSQEKKQKETSQAGTCKCLIPAFASHWFLRTPTHNRWKASDGGASGHHHLEITHLKQSNSGMHKVSLQKRAGHLEPACYQSMRRPVTNSPFSRVWTINVR